MDVLLPKFRDLGIEVQLVTSAVRPIPLGWRDLTNLDILVSIDGLAPEHDRRRAPATYDRILKHIAGHRVTVHCTITRQQLQRAEYLSEFARFWSGREGVGKIWFSLFTPQRMQQTEERLTPQDRVNVVSQLACLRQSFPKVDIRNAFLEGYLRPPASPQECIFAQTTTCVSADLATRIVPYQFGGDPVCSECGCIASAGLASIGRYKVLSLVPVSAIFRASRMIGAQVDKWLTE